jgi:adenosylcobinamide-GDP ribazoletransferase
MPDGPMSVLGGALVAFRYLTVLPLPRSRVPGDLGRAAGWFPLVGLGLGLCLALASLGVDRIVPPGVGAMLLIVLWAALTGGLHLDGLADTCDGLGGGWSRERALSIMRDARSGPYGVTAIVLVLGLKAAAVTSLPEGLAWRALVLAPLLGRTGPLLLVRLCPPARPEGAGHAFSAGARWPALVAGGLVALLASVATLGAWGALALGGTGLLAWGLAGHLRRRLGGFTGDTLGALVEVTEAGVLTFAVSLDFLELA